MNVYILLTRSHFKGKTHNYNKVIITIKSGSIAFLSKK